MTFDLEKVRATYSAGCVEDAANLAPDLIAEIERLRKENLELQVAVIGPDATPPESNAIDVNMGGTKKLSSSAMA